LLQDCPDISACVHDVKELRSQLDSKSQAFAKLEQQVKQLQVRSVGPGRVMLLMPLLL
jgi:hypothetical protein